MPRALPGTVKVLLAIAVVVPAPLASAQFLARFRRQQTPAQKGRYEVDAILSDEHQRLAEMKVELALLGDIATFPYDFVARANGNTLEVRGNVPNEMVRQRAMELARSSTFLRGIDALRIQSNLSVRSSLRPQNVVQQEGMELLQKERGMSAKHISVEARPNGVVILTGSTDCVESKVEISRLFRQLPGCTAVVNQLEIEPILLDGHRVVRVTHNNMLLVPPSAVGQESEPLPASPAPADRQPTISPLAPLRASNLNAREGELSLPAAAAQKQSSTPTKLAVKKVGNDEASAPSKVPVKWSRPAGGWEAQAKDLEALNSPATPTDRQKNPTPQTPPKSAKMAWTPQSAHPQDEKPSPLRMVGRPADTNKTQASVAANKPNQTSPISHPNIVAKRVEPDSVMTWRRPGGSEESEPKDKAPAIEPRASTSGASSPSAEILGPANSTSPALSLRSPRRWPPAYVTGPPPSQGRLGVVAFDDNPPPPSKLKPTVIATPPPSKPKPTVIATSRSLAPAELQRQIKSLCGRQAREVVAAEQKDGSVLVRVKVASRSIEDQLARKILSLPDMNSPKVRLMMEIEP